MDIENACAKNIPAVFPKTINGFENSDKYTPSRAEYKESLRFFWRRTRNEREKNPFPGVLKDFWKPDRRLANHLSLRNSRPRQSPVSPGALRSGASAASGCQRCFFCFFAVCGLKKEAWLFNLAGCGAKFPEEEE
jgi:hypothetical protein